jgi:hypothetical protein
MNTPPPVPKAPPPKLTWYEHVWIGWPLALVAVGGGIGGACGGAAWGINRVVFLSIRQPVLRYLVTGLISVAAIVIYLVVASVVVTALQKAH